MDQQYIHKLVWISLYLCLSVCAHCFPLYLTSSIDFLLQCSLITLMAHSRSCSPRGTFTLSCLRRPTWNSWWSSRRVLGVRTRSVVASRLPCNHAIALQRKQIMISSMLQINVNKLLWYYESRDVEYEMYNSMRQDYKEKSVDIFHETKCCSTKQRTQNYSHHTVHHLHTSLYTSSLNPSLL